MKISRNSLLLCLLAAAPLSAQISDLAVEQEVLFAAAEVEGVSKHAENPLKSPATVTVVPGEEIRRLGFKTLEEVMQFAAPGFWVLSGREYAYLGGRGAFDFGDYNSRVLLLLNGHVMNEPWNNFAALGREFLVPMDLVDRVEIVSGPSALLYGGNALYGMINVITISPDVDPGTQVRVGAGADHAFEAQVAQLGNSTIGERLLRYTVAAGNYRTDGENLNLAAFPLDDGSLWGGPQSGTDREEAPWAFAQARVGDWSFQGRWGYREKGNPTAWYGSSYGDPRNQIEDDKSFLEAAYRHSFGPDTEITFRTYMDWYGYLEEDVYDDGEAFPGEPGYLYVLDSPSRLWGAEVRLGQWWGRHYLTVGAEYRSNRVDQFYHMETFSGEVMDANSSRVSTRFSLFYIQDELRLSRAWTVVAGGTYAAAEPGEDTALPRLAVIYQPQDSWSVKLVAGSGFRTPSVIEYAPLDDYILPNEHLKPEQMDSIEAALSARVARHHWIHASVFTNRLSDRIILTPLDGEEDGLYRYENEGHSRSRGMTVAWEGRAGAWSARAGATFQKGEIWSEESYQDAGGVPERLAQAMVSYRGGLLFGGLAAHWRSALRAPGEHADDPSGHVPSGGVMNANIGVQWTAFIPMALELKLENLLDADFFQPASEEFTPHQYPYRGRRAILQFTARF